MAVEFNIRVARAMIPFGAAADDVISRLEGGKRRTRDGRLSFVDSAGNLAIIRSQFPGLDIELPPDGKRDPVRSDKKIGLYSSRINPALYSHQTDALTVSRDKEFFAYFCEQGTGKTRIAIERMGEHFALGEISGVLIITFKGVHRQWIETQLPEHIGNIDGKQIAYKAQAWDKKPVVWTAINRNILEIFSINFDALRTAGGGGEVEKFVNRHKGGLMTVIDESHAIKQYNSARTEHCIAIGSRSRYRIIMSGTPLPSKLEDEWSQSMFMSETIFGHRYVTSFRAIYTDGDGGPRNVNEFVQRMAPHSYRITKDEALDLPPKIYEQFRFDLGPVARKAYNELKRNFLTTVGLQITRDQREKVATVTVQNAAVLLLRLQQITCGELIGEDGTRIKVGNERMNALQELLPKYEAEKKIIIWARFRPDLDNIAAVCKPFGDCALLHGGVDEADRWKEVKKFMAPNGVRFLISNPAVGGTGFNFQGECRTNIYYSNSFNSVHRWQSEDRTARIGQYKPVDYIDLIANNTVDNLLVRNLKDKKDFAELVLDLSRALNSESQ